jgi:hypothetical protein
VAGHTASSRAKSEPKVAFAARSASSGASRARTDDLLHAMSEQAASACFGLWPIRPARRGFVDLARQPAAVSFPLTLPSRFHKRRSPWPGQPAGRRPQKRVWRARARARGTRTLGTEWLLRNGSNWSGRRLGGRVRCARGAALRRNRAERSLGRRWSTPEPDACIWRIGGLLPRAPRVLCSCWRGHFS